MDTTTLTFVLSLAGFIIVLCFSIIGFFLNRLVGDVRHSVEEAGKNKGRIELVEQQLTNDTKRIEAMTQLELKVMSQNVSDLSKNVNTLVVALAKKGINS
jgi:hypothetical protein